MPRIKLKFIGPGKLPNERQVSYETLRGPRWLLVPVSEIDEKDQTLRCTSKATDGLGIMLSIHCVRCEFDIYEADLSHGVIPDSSCPTCGRSD